MRGLFVSLLFESHYCLCLVRFNVVTLDVCFNTWGNIRLNLCDSYHKLCRLDILSLCILQVYHHVTHFSCRNIVKDKV